MEKIQNDMHEGDGGAYFENLTTARIGALLKRFLITGTIMSCTGRKTRATHTFGRSYLHSAPFGYPLPLNSQK